VTRVIRIFDRILNVTLVLTCIFITLLMLIVCFEVAMRFLFGRPSVWTVEIAGHMLLYIPFLVGAWVLKREGHVKMDLVLNRLDPKNQALLSGITSALGAIVCFIAAWFAAKVTLGQFQTGYLTQTTMMLPEWPIMGIIPVGIFLLFIQFLRRTFYYLTQWKGAKVKVSEQAVISG